MCARTSRYVTHVYLCFVLTLSCLFIECRDGVCEDGYYCGSPLPRYGNNDFTHPNSIIPGNVIFLQKDPQYFSGMNMTVLSADFHPQLIADLTIFATVNQEPGNDGYVVAKGRNDRIRDFGLYLRSSLKTIWLVYAVGSDIEEFAEILVFTDVSVDDRNDHSVAVVIDIAINQAILYIDGVAKNSKTLPSIPVFRPGVSPLNFKRVK